MIKKNFSDIPKVSITILNWNGWKDTIECLSSLFKITYKNFTVFLVDNNSTDNSSVKLENWLLSENFEVEDINNINSSQIVNIKKFNRENIELFLLNLNRNWGFAEGNNIAIKYINKNFESDYILLLNNDLIVKKNFLDILVKVSEQDSIGIAGSQVLFYNNSQVHSMGANISWYKGISDLIKLNREKKPYFTVDYVSGCSFLIKKDLFSLIGYLNPEYFLYWEEVDFCIRAKSKGFDTVCVPSSIVWHKVGSSSKSNGVKDYYLTRNMFWFMKTHATKFQYTIFLIYFFFFRMFYLISLYLFYNRNLRALYCFFRGINDGLVS